MSGSTQLDINGYYFNQTLLVSCCLADQRLSLPTSHFFFVFKENPKDETRQVGSFSSSSFECYIFLFGVIFCKDSIISTSLLQVFDEAKQRDRLYRTEKWHGGPRHHHRFYIFCLLFFFFSTY